MDDFLETDGEDYPVYPDGSDRAFYTRWRPGETKKRGPRPRFSHPRKRLVLALVDDLVGRDPRHHGAQLLADHLDLVSGVVATVGGHRRVVGRAFGDEHLGVLTVLDALQCVAHGGTGLLVDHFRTGDVLTVLGVVGDRVVHVGDPAFEHQVNDQLELVQAFEVGHFRRVPSFDQEMAYFECLHELKLIVDLMFEGG